MALLGPRAGLGLYGWVDGVIEWENPYDEQGRPKPGYSCQTVSRQKCVEDCVLKRLMRDTFDPPRYRVGQGQCDQYSTDVMTDCASYCGGRR